MNLTTQLPLYVKNECSHTSKEISYSDQTLTFANHSKKFQKVVRPTRSLRQQWPLRRTKNGDLSIVFFSLVGQRTCQHPCTSAPLYAFMVWAGITLTLPLLNYQRTQDFTCNHPGPTRMMANFYMRVTVLAMTKCTAQAAEPCTYSHASATNIQWS